ncbi:MAG: hypothetical protein ACNA8P_07870, partial [Phycisphaerales bacterium]
MVMSNSKACFGKPSLADGFSVASMVTDDVLHAAMVLSLDESRQSEPMPVMRLDTVRHRWSAAQALNYAIEN